MTFSFIIASCAGAMLASALLMVSRMRLASLVALLRIQALLLSVIALLIAAEHLEVHLLFMAFLIFSLKALLIPTVLVRMARRSGASERLTAYARPTTLSLSGAALAAVGFLAARAFPVPGESFLVIAASFSLVLLGFFLLISRKDMFGQGVGLLVLENGIFTFGLVLVGGMPLLVELGILFDLLIFFALSLMLMRRAQEEHASTATDYLRSLID